MSEQLTDRYCVLVNGHAVEPGCWVDGHWGQYGPDHLADRAEELGWKASHPTDDPRELRRCAESEPPATESWRDWYWEVFHEATDDLESWLNEHTETEGYSWGWHDGEFYLWPFETWRSTTRRPSRSCEPR